MMTVSAAVICGVTVRSSAASLNVTVTVLLAMVCSGICTPCITCASTLFSVDTRGVDRIRPLPDCSSAVNAMSRLKAPFTDPSEMPTPLVAEPTGRLTAVGVAAPPAGPWSGPTRPERLPLFGNARFVVLPRAGSTRPLKPHWTPSSRAKLRLVWTIRASISTCGCALSSVSISCDGGLQAIGQVSDDQRIGSRIDLDGAPL